MTISARPSKCTSTCLQEFKLNSLFIFPVQIFFLKKIAVVTSFKKMILKESRFDDS